MYNNPYTAGKAWVLTQHYGYWFSAKVPDHQYPQCWLRIHDIGTATYENIAISMNSITKQNHIWEQLLMGLKFK